MSNEVALRLWIGKPPCRPSSRFSAFGLPAGQDAKRAGRSSHPAQLYSRSTTLESLSIPQRSGGDLSVALSFIERLDCIILFLFGKSGLTFNAEMGSFSMIILMSQLTNWVHFR